MRDRSQVSVGHLFNSGDIFGNDLRNRGCARIVLTVLSRLAKWQYAKAFASGEFRTAQKYSNG